MADPSLSMKLLPIGNFVAARWKFHLSLVAMGKAVLYTKHSALVT